MKKYLETEWLTAAAVILLLFGSFILDSTALTMVAGVLLVTGVIFMRKDRVRGGLAGLVGLVVAAAMVVILRLVR